MEFSMTHAITQLHGDVNTFMPRNGITTEPESNGAKNVETRKAELREAAEGFEAIFIRQFLKSMRDTLPGEGMFGKGIAGEIYAGMMDEAVADAAARRGAFGIADAVYRQLSKNMDSSTENDPQEKPLHADIY